MRPNRALLLVALGLLAPVAITSAPAGAALEQDLVASVTAGPPGTVVTLSSATCTPPGDGEAYLDLTLYSGTGTEEKLAGYASGTEGSASLTIPDWVDPDQPATIEGSCSTYVGEGDDYQDITYDPVSFDVEPGSGTPVQVPAFSRTSLLSGQGTRVSSAGCGDAYDAMVYAVPGTDLSGRADQFEEGAYGFGTITDGSFEADLAMTNAYVLISIGGDGPDDLTFDVAESPNTLAPGPYSVFTSCRSLDDSALYLEPTVIELTGTVDTTGMDLTVADQQDLTLAGTCAQGDVAGWLEGQSYDDLTGDPRSQARDELAARVPGLASSEPGTYRVRAGASGLTTGTDRALTEGSPSPFEATPDGSGAWSTVNSVDFARGFVVGAATCGDPIDDGYYYDSQIVEIEKAEVPQLVPPTVPATVPPAPANALPGTPTYAG